MGLIALGTEVLSGVLHQNMLLLVDGGRLISAEPFVTRTLRARAARPAPFKSAAFLDARINEYEDISGRDQENGFRYQDYLATEKVIRDSRSHTNQISYETGARAKTTGRLPVLQTKCAVPHLPASDSGRSREPEASVIRNHRSHSAALAGGF